MCVRVRVSGTLSLSVCVCRKLDKMSIVGPDARVSCLFSPSASFRYYRCVLGSLRSRQLVEGGDVVGVSGGGGGRRIDRREKDKMLHPSHLGLG